MVKKKQIVKRGSPPTFKESYTEYLEWIKTHNNVFPKKNSEDPTEKRLGVWANTRRRDKREDSKKDSTQSKKLSPEQLKQFEAI